VNEYLRQLQKADTDTDIDADNTTSVDGNSTDVGNSTSVDDGNSTSVDTSTDAPVVATSAPTSSPDLITANTGAGTKKDKKKNQKKGGKKKKGKKNKGKRELAEKKPSLAEYLVIPRSLVNNHK
jgi:hypothetical protein